MAISLNTIVINTLDFVLNGRTLKAEFTPEVDTKFGDILIELQALFNAAEKLDDEDMDTQKAELKRIYAEIAELGSQYIKALFNEDDATYILEALGGRTINIANMTRKLFEAGSGEANQENRETRRKA